MHYLEIKAVDGGTINMSKLALGSAQYGQRVSKDMAFAVMDKFYELGGNTIDTGRSYGSEDDLVSFGLAEGIIADWIKSRGVRDSVNVITKGGFPELGAEHAILRSRINPEEIRDDFYKSLDVFGGKIDVYMLHRDNPDVPVSEIMDTLDEFVKKGLVRSLAASNWSLDRVIEANDYAKAHGMAPFIANEIQWSYPQANIPDPTSVFMTREIYHDYEKRGIPIICSASQAGGLFIRLYKGELEWDNLPPFMNAMKSDLNWRKFCKLKQMCDERGYAPAAVGTAYMACNHVAAVPLIGPWTPEECADSMQGAELILSEADIAWLDEAYEE